MCSQTADPDDKSEDYAVDLHYTFIERDTFSVVSLLFPLLLLTVL
jgi:hypothetical protein